MLKLPLESKAKSGPDFSKVLNKNKPMMRTMPDKSDALKRRLSLAKEVMPKGKTKPVVTPQETTEVTVTDTFAKAKAKDSAKPTENAAEANSSLLEKFKARKNASA